MNIKFYLSIIAFQIFFYHIAEGQLNARVYITNLEHEYDGTPKTVNVRTVPLGLKVIVTYNGDEEAPVNAGKYTVHAEVEASFWRGSATEEMIISPVKATIALSGTTHKYDGKQKQVVANTSPPNLKVKFSYQPSPPINAGTYQVTATIDEQNYEGSANTTLVIEKANASVAFENTIQQFDGSPKSVTVITNPEGLTTTVTYNNSQNAPSNAGKYDVKAIINEQNYVGQQTGTFVINSSPKVISTPNISVMEDADPTIIDLKEVFEDPDDWDKLTYSLANNSNEDLVQVSFEGDKLIITYQKDAHGLGELTIVAEDNYEASVQVTILVDVSSVNDPPRIEIDQNIVLFIPVKDSPQPLIESVTIDDPDDDYLTGAQLFFNPRAFERNADLLLFEEVGNIKGVYSREAGTLNLTGLDTKENYERALKLVKYDNRIGLTFNENRIVTIYVDDGKASSNFVHKEIELMEGFISLNIPSGFTPNQDNVNNTWRISNLERYPDATITVFNRSGQVVFNSTDDNVEWDGMYNGIPAPVGSYYYVISIPSYQKVFTGPVTIIR